MNSRIPLDFTYVSIISHESVTLWNPQIFFKILSIINIYIKNLQESPFELEIWFSQTLKFKTYLMVQLCTSNLYIPTNSRRLILLLCPHSCLFVVNLIMVFSSIYSLGILFIYLRKCISVTHKMQKIFIWCTMKQLRVVSDSLGSNLGRSRDFVLLYHPFSD